MIHIKKYNDPEITTCQITGWETAAEEYKGRLDQYRTSFSTCRQGGLGRVDINDKDAMSYEAPMLCHTKHRCFDIKSRNHHGITAFGV
jgi:hypothetical protein